MSPRTFLCPLFLAEVESRCMHLSNSTVCETGCFWLDVTVKRLSYQANKWTAEEADRQWLEMTFARGSITIWPIGMKGGNIKVINWLPCHSELVNSHYPKCELTLQMRIGEKPNS